MSYYKPTLRDPLFRALLDHLDLVVDEAGNFAPPDHVLDRLIEVLSESEGWDWLLSEYIDGDKLVAEYAGRYALTGDFGWAAKLRGRYLHLCRKWVLVAVQDMEPEIMRRWCEMHQAKADEFRADMRQAGGW